MNQDEHMDVVEQGITTITPLTNSSNASTKASKRRREMACRSEHWKSFEKFTKGTEVMARCLHCERELRANPQNGTTPLKNHLASCKGNNPSESNQPELVGTGLQARSSFAMNTVSTMEILKDTTYESWTTWKLNFELAMNLLGLELAIEEDRPEEPTKTGLLANKLKYGTWEKGNRLGLMLMKSRMSNSIFTYLELKKKPDTVREMLAAVERMVMDNERMTVPVMLNKLNNMRYNGRGNVREHLMEMVSISTRLRAVDYSLPDSTLKEHMLNSLPPKFDHIRLYCTHSREGCDVHEIVKRCWMFETTANLCK